MEAYHEIAFRLGMHRPCQANAPFESSGFSVGKLRSSEHADMPGPANTRGTHGSALVQ